MIVYLDGKFVPEAEAVVSVFDRCFLYGDGLFEAIRLYQGKPFRWNQHFERLQAGARDLKIAIPQSADRLHVALGELWQRNDSPADAVVRLTLSRGVGTRGYSPASAIHPRMIMALHPLPSQQRCESFKIITSSVVVAAGDALSKHKTCNKLHHVMARAEADAAGAQEALIVNTKGFVAEATSSNFFWIVEDAIFTPPFHAGAMAGITRSVVFEIAAQFQLRVSEVDFTPRDLRGVGGAFLSTSSQELVEITEIDGNALSRSSIFAKLKEAYRELVKKELEIDLF